MNMSSTDPTTLESKALARFHRKWIIPLAARGVPPLAEREQQRRGTEDTFFVHRTNTGMRPEDFDLRLSDPRQIVAALQKQWKEELRRVLRPDGHLIISTHGAAYLDELTAAERISFHSGELVVRRDTEPGTNRCGVFCSEDSVRRHFSPEFMVRDFVASGAHGNPPQDLVLLQPNVPS